MSIVHFKKNIASILRTTLEFWSCDFKVFSFKRFILHQKVPAARVLSLKDKKVFMNMTSPSDFLFGVLVHSLATELCISLEKKPVLCTK